MTKSARRESILVVEDNDNHRNHTASLLKSLFPGVTVSAARNAEEAIEKFERRPPLVIVLDMDLGEGPDGIELLQALRGRPQPFKAIGLTGFSRLYAFRAGANGVDAFLEKPLNGDELFKAIAEQLRLARGSAKKAQDRLAFCVMPFATDFLDRYLFGIKMAAEQAGYGCFRADEEVFTTDVLIQVQRYIRKADVVIADLTGNNPNVCYEVGYAHALKKPVVLLSSSAQDILFNVRNMRHIVYEGKIHKLQSELVETLQKIPFRRTRLG